MFIEIQDRLINLGAYRLIKRSIGEEDKIHFFRCGSMDDNSIDFSLSFDSTEDRNRAYNEICTRLGIGNYYKHE